MSFFSLFSVFAAIFSLIGLVLSIICIVKLDHISEDIYQIKDKPRFKTPDLDIYNPSVHGSKRKNSHSQKNNYDYSCNPNISHTHYLKEVRLVLINFNKHLRSEHLITDSLILGRGSFCDYDTHDYYVSGQHCRFILVKNKLYIEDMKSTNGTYLNGIKLDGAAMASSGDMLTIGNSQYQIYLQFIYS